MLAAAEWAQLFSLYNLGVILVALKVLMFLAEHLADMDVHRWWLAVTHARPLREWYPEVLQPGLTCPPFFAYFEWALSQLVPPGVRADGCLALDEHAAYGWPTVVFQRCTVVVLGLVLWWLLQWYVNSTAGSIHERRKSFVVALLLALSPGLLLMDHLHFQYNGVAFGVFVAALNAARLERFELCTALFLVLVCFDHTFMWLAPAVFAHIFRVYCLDLHRVTDRESAMGLVRWRNLARVTAIGTGILIVALGPFAYTGTLAQLHARLSLLDTPLTHHYWAPNAWAVYSFVDRVLVYLCQHVPGMQMVLTRFFFSETLSPESLALAGAAQHGQFAVLPAVTPQISVGLTLFYSLMAVLPVLYLPLYYRLLGSLVLCAYAGFVFGWHVPAKAVMVVIFPFSFLVVHDKRLLLLFQLLAGAGYVLLFPLVVSSAAWLLKGAYTYLWMVVYMLLTEEVATLLLSLLRRVFHMDRFVKVYIIALVPLVVWLGLVEVGQRHYLAHLAGLREVVLSMYCTVGVLASWGGASWLYFVDDLLWAP